MSKVEKCTLARAQKKHNPSIYIKCAAFDQRIYELWRRKIMMIPDTQYEPTIISQSTLRIPQDHSRNKGRVIEAKGEEKKNYELGIILMSYAGKHTPWANTLAVCVFHYKSNQHTNPTLRNNNNKSKTTTTTSSKTEQAIH